MAFVTNMESSIDGAVFPAGQIQTTHLGRPLWVRYDLEAVGNAVDPFQLRRRPAGMWRYRELLPVPRGDELVTLGEEATPLLPARRLGTEIGLRNLWIKDESRLPTGSFKSRGMAVAVTMARRFGLRRLAIPTAGNAGAALAAYAARAGMESYVFMPEDTPKIIQIETVLSGGRVFLVSGLLPDCGRIVRDGIGPMGWFDCSTLREPYRLEGKKTMGLELADQLDWSLPDVIVYPTGGGTGLIGMWKAFEELIALGWLANGRRPRMIAVQSDGCAPLVRAFDRGAEFAEPWEDARTCASGLQVPSAIGDFMILRAIRASGGIAVAAEKSRIKEAIRDAGRLEGLALGPEGSTGLVALRQLVRARHIDPDERVILFNTGTSLKYVDLIEMDLPVLAADRAVDFAALSRGFPTPRPSRHVL